MEKATREQSKTHNSRLVLKTVYQKRFASRADVARATHLTRTTVSDIVAELMADGLLAETGMGESGGGKPPILLEVCENARLLVCLDLTTRPFSGALVNLRGKICKRLSAPNGKTGGTGPAALQAAFGLIDGLVREVSAPVIGIGIGVPGLTDPVKGVVRRSVHLDWTDLPLGTMLKERYHLPVYLLNDSHATALAEATFGDLKGLPNLIAVRIAEGIGAGILLSGQLHFGDGYGAGEIGHLAVVEDGRLCSCGNYGCLETVASPDAILLGMREMVQAGRVAWTGKAEPGAIDWNFVLDSFRQGDETTSELVREAGKYLGISIANLVSILNIQHIVISGKYNVFGDTFLKAVSQEVRQRALQTMTADTQISHSKLGEETILLGVSALMLSKEMGLP